MIDRCRLLPHSRASAHASRALARCATVSALALGLPNGAAHGQALRIPSGVGEAQVVAEAEADGAAFRRLPNSQGTDALPRTCVVGHEMGPARSGEFVIGGSLGGTAAMVAGRPGKVWWAPVHHARDMPALVVRGRSLTSPSDTVRFTTASVAWPVVPGAPAVAEAERKYFFPSGIIIPRAGRWLVIATSGANWGCFILTVS